MFYNVNIHKKLCQKKWGVVCGGAYILCCKKGVGGAGKNFAQKTPLSFPHTNTIPHTISPLQQKSFATKKHYSHLLTVFHPLLHLLI